MSDSPLNETVSELKKLQEAAKKAAEESDDVKAGKCTLEDELQEPGYILYNQIAETNIKILSMPSTQEMFAKIANGLGDDNTKTLVELLVVIMTQSAHQAVLFYNDQLKAELTKQFDHLGEHVNINRAEIKAQESAIKVFKAQLSELQKKAQIDSFAKENGVTPQE